MKKKRFAKLTGHSHFKGQTFEIDRVVGNLYFLKVNMGTEKRPTYQTIPYVKSMVREITT
ncbi:MAG: hypothetical protein LBG64_00890 [Pseudomonadales bacterium]|jgi:hypothetical protein|nr:hypothetical protein [Pseudomonadales bacterium]